MSEFLAGFCVIFVLIYWVLGWGGNKKIKEERDTLSNQLAALIAENVRLRADIATLKAYNDPIKTDPYSFYRQQQAYQYQNPFQNAYNPFTGFAPGQGRAQQAPILSEWRRVFGFGASDAVTKEKLSSAFREKAMRAHPDKGGNDSEMAKLNSLRQQALAEIGA